MRIAIITPGFSAEETDWCIPALLDFVAHLGERHDVTVFTHSYPPKVAQYTVYRARVESFAHPRRSLARNLLACRHAIVARHREQPFDLIHVCFAGLTGAIGTSCAAALGIPSIVTVMGGELMDMMEPRYGGNASVFNKLVNRYALNRATGVATLSQRAAELFADHLPTGAHWHITPFGVDLNLFSPIGDVASISGSTRFLLVGSLEPVKGHDIALRALAAVRPTNGVMLHIVGAGSIEDHLRAQVDALGLANHVQLHRPVDHARLADYYRAADALVVASHFETQSMVTLEAAACGCPVIGSRVGIVAEIAASTVAPGDATALADQLRSVMASPGFRAREGPRARAKVEQSFELSSRIAAVESLYGSVLDPH